MADERAEQQHELEFVDVLVDTLEHAPPSPLRWEVAAAVQSFLAERITAATRRRAELAEQLAEYARAIQLVDPGADLEARRTALRERLDRLDRGA